MAGRSWKNVDWEEYWRPARPTGEVRQHIIRAFLPLVRAIALRVKRALPPGVPLDDLISVGAIGLIAAVDRFEPERGHNFTKYAAIRIRGTILDELRSMDWVPRYLRDEEEQLSAARRTLEGKLGRAATPEEMAGSIGLDLNGYDELLRRLAPRRQVGIDELTSRGDDGELMDTPSFLVDPAAPDPAAVDSPQDLREVLVAAVSELEARQKQMITFYYFRNLKLKDIGRIFGVTEGRVCQIHTAALKALRRKLARKI